MITLHNRPEGAVTTPSPDRGAPLIEAFACALAKPGGRALLIDPHNRGGKWVPIPEAVATGRCFAVDVSTEILAVDADDPALEAEVDNLAVALRHDGLRPVIVASGRPGHRHLFCLIRDRDLLAGHAARARAAHLDVRLTIRPPLSPHRAGLQVRLIEPADPGEALAALTPAPSVSEPRQLSRRLDLLLRNGDRGGRYRSRSESVLALTMGAWGAGWTLEDLIGALLDPRNTGGAKVQEIATRSGTGAARQYVVGRWRKAEVWASRRPTFRGRPDALEEISRIRAAAAAQKWKGMGRASAWAVLQGHCLVAERAGGPRYGASVREIAELAGVSIATVSRAQVRLVRGRWLRRLRRGRCLEASTWELRRPAHLMGSLPGTFSSRPRRGDGDVPPASPRGATPSGDAWRWIKGLGKSTLRAAIAIGPETATPRQVAERLGVTVRTVRRHLRRLERLRLVRRDVDGQWSQALETESTGHAADVLECTGIGARQTWRHQDQREIWCKLLRAPWWLQEGSQAAASRRGRPPSHQGGRRS